MRFIELSLENWGPYRGTQTIDLSSPNSAPLVLIFGENGRGKTSLAKAIKWCLYEDQSGIDELSMANRQMIASGDQFRVGTTIKFEWAYDNPATSEASTTLKTFELSRTFEVKQDARSSHGIRTIGKTECSLTIDGEPVIPAQINKIVLRIAPVEMANFLLFDGEELKRMIEDLGGNEKVSVRGRIESTMGLSALADIEQTISTELKIIDKRIKIKSRNKILDDEIDRLTANLTRTQNERSDLSKEKVGLENKVELLKRSLEKYESFSATIKLLEDREKSLKRSKADLSNKREEIVKLLQTSWWLPLGDRIEKRQERELQRLEDSKTLQTIGVLEQILETQRCSVCEAEHSDLSQVRERIRELRHKVSKEAESEDEPQSFRNLFPQVAVRRLEVSVLFQDEREHIHEVSSLEGEVSRLKAELLNIDQDQHNSLLSDFQASTRTLGRADKELDRLNQEIALQENELKSKRRERARMEDVPADDEAQQTALLQLEEIVTNLRDNLTNKVRQEVEDVASAHYRVMMNNEDLVGVRITPDYSIRAVHRTLGEKPFSSFGQSLIYVYAFVAALIEVSALRNPWLIDTVGSRLDQSRMHAVWLWLSQRDRQIIAMPHSNELTPSQAKQWMFDSISRMYEIVPNELQDSDSRIEEIVK